MLDVWTPSPLIFRAPAYRYAEHELLFSLEQGRSNFVPNRRKKFSLLRRHPTKSTLAFPDSSLIFDCRHDSTSNIAHVLQNQVGVALQALKALGVDRQWRDLIFILKETTADHSVCLIESLGFRTRKVSGPVSGTLLRMEPRKLPLRAKAAEFLRAHALEIGVLSDHDTAESPVFLARRGRRTLVNMHEIEPILNKAGYCTTYLEELSPEKQIQTVANAQMVWGLHGAGMGYIMFRNPSSGGVIIECFSSGFATNWARTNSAAIHNSWLGGLGDLDGRMIADMQNGAHPHTHEAKNYKLHLKSVVRLISLAETAYRNPTELYKCESIDCLGMISLDLTASPASHLGQKRPERA
jgi:hypothetical protein